MEFLENPPCCLVLRNKGGVSKQHQILQNFRAFGADFDPIYSVIIHLNDVFGLLRAAGDFFSIYDAFLSDFPLETMIVLTAKLEAAVTVPKPTSILADDMMPELEMAFVEPPPMI